MGIYGLIGINSIVEDANRVERMFQHIQDQDGAEGRDVLKNLQIVGMLKVCYEVSAISRGHIRPEVLQTIGLADFSTRGTAIAGAEFEDRADNYSCAYESSDVLKICTCHFRDSEP